MQEIIKNYIDRASRWLDSISHTCCVFIFLMILSFCISKDNMGYCFFVFSILLLVLKYHSYIRKFYFSIKNGEVSIELTNEIKESFNKLGFECYDCFLKAVTPDNIDEYKQKKLSLPLTLQNKNGEKVEVNTLNDYEKYAQNGYEAATTYDINTETYYGVVNYFLRYVLTVNNVLYSLLELPAIKVLSSSIDPDFEEKVGSLSVRQYLEKNSGSVKMKDECLELSINDELYCFKVLSKLTVIESTYEEYFISLGYKSGGTLTLSNAFILRKIGSSVELL